MSAIAGVFNSAGRPADPGNVGAMLERMAHRAPDGTKVWTDGPVSLGHGQLRTTPESVIERLPLSHPESSVVLTCDARIDNRSDLCSVLGFNDRPATQVTDSDLILAAYLKWGDACPSHLIGDFAFVVWDPRSQKMFGARDPAGIKQLYYHNGEGTFRFASEVHALLEGPGFRGAPVRLNEMVVVNNLVPRYVAGDQTCYEGIRRLPPAHCFDILASSNLDASDLRLRQYYEMDVSRELRLGSDGEYDEAFKEIFSEAVRCRLRGYGEPGVTLSGGLDSSSIACVARREYPAGESIHAFSAVFPSLVVADPTIDETPYARTVLALGGYHRHDVEADRPKYVRDVLKVDSAEIVNAPNLYMTEALLQAADDANVRVLLSGFEGDATISYGLEYLSELANENRWARFSSECAAVAKNHPLYATRYLFEAYGLPAIRSFAMRHRWASFAHALLSIPREAGYSRRQVVRFVRRAVSPTPPWILNTALVAELPDESSHKIAGGDTPTTDNYRDVLRRMHANEIAHPFLQYLLGAFDAMAARRGVEQRYPFFDRRLVEFCVAVPFDQRLRHGRTRFLLRRAMKGIVPDEVLARFGKGVIGSNLRVQLAAATPQIVNEVSGHAGEMSRGFARSLLDVIPDSSRYLDVDQLNEALERFIADPSSASEQDVFTVFLALSFVTWMRRAGL